MYRKLIVIIAIFVVGCSSSSVCKTQQQQVSEKDSLVADTSGKEVVVSDKMVDEEDTFYRNNVFSYKDSIDRKIGVMRKVHYDLEDLGLEGAECTIYISEMDTLRMDITVYGEMGKGMYVLYIKDSSPVFYFSHTFYYDEPVIVSGHPKVNKRDSDTVILRNYAIVKWIKNGIEMKAKYEEKSRDVKYMYDEIQSQIKE